jgi:hypothetical protein
MRRRTNILVGGIALAETDIFAHRSAEQHNVLEHPGKVL